MIYDYPRSYIYGDEVLNEHEIWQLDSISFDGHECIVQYITDTIPGIFAIEGIGCVDYGILPIYNLLAYVTGYQDFYKLNRVYNTDGEILYSNPEGCLDIPSSVDSLRDDVYLSCLNGILEVKDIGNMISAKLYNLNGEIVMDADGYNQLQLNTGELNPGIYIAKAGHKTLKIVVR